MGYWLIMKTFFGGTLGKMLIIVILAGGVYGSGYFHGDKHATTADAARHAKEIQDYIEKAKEQAALDRKAQQAAADEIARRNSMETDLKNKIADLASINASYKSCKTDKEVVKNLDDIFKNRMIK